jgi:hypothetical protein
MQFVFRFSQYFTYLVWGGCFFLVVGCSDDKINFYLVQGKVTLQGKALAEGVVTFVPKTGPAVRGLISADGTYQLEIPVGPSRISVAPAPGLQPTIANDARAPDQIENLPPQVRKPQQEIPERYADHKTSNLAYEVRPNSDNRFDISL